MGNAGHAALNVVLSTSNCMTCHSGAYLGTKTFKAHGKGNLCGTCHKSFTKGTGDVREMDVTALNSNSRSECPN